MGRINYSSWPRLSLSVSNLKLDKENPRIPTYVSTRTIKDVLSYLFEYEKVDRLAEKIVDKGFISHDPIYVVKENGSYVVVEGNRRVSALKCLLDPSLVPSASKKRKLERLKNKLGQDKIEKIDVYVAPSRKEVQNVLFELHAEGKLQWNRQQKNQFIASVGVNSNESIEEIAARFNVKPSEIQDSVQEYYLERYFTELSLPTDIEDRALNAKFSISIMSRLVNSSCFKSLTGFKIERGKLQTTISKYKFDYLLRNFIIDILNKIIDSRKLNKTIEIERYIQSIFEQISDEESDEPVDYTPPINTSPDVKSKSKKRNKKTAKMLIPPEKQYQTGLQKLDILIEEAQGMMLDMHKTASALLLRTILELTTVRVFDINNKKDRCINENNGRVKNLSDNLSALTKQSSWFQNPAYLADLTRFISKNNSDWNSLDSLNRYAHGEYTLPDKNILQAVWLITEPLVEMCCSKNT